MSSAHVLSLGLALVADPGRPPDFYGDLVTVVDLAELLGEDDAILRGREPVDLPWIDFCIYPEYRERNPDQCDGVTRVEHVDLHVDLSTGRARAEVLLEPRGVEQVRLALVTTSAVTVQPMGPPLSGLMSTHDGVELTIEAMGVLRQFAIEYTIPNVPRTARTWPDQCGTLFPCVSDPSDAMTWDLEVVGQGDGQASVYAASQGTPAPAYMLAWATGPWANGTNQLPVRTTPRGTEVRVWHLPGRHTIAEAGTFYLPEVVSYFEDVLGPYAFGASIGSIEIQGLPFNGLEHHPYAHVRRQAMRDRTVHAHEAAHAWFGNGVRIECWEDFALSEGVVTYLTAVGLEHTEGTPAACAEWADYRNALGAGVAVHRSSAADPTCNDIDPSTLTYQSYVKPAHFLLAIENALNDLDRDGRAEILAALSRFFTDHEAEAAGFWDLVAAIEADTRFDTTALASTWLLSSAAPAPGAIPRLDGCP